MIVHAQEFINTDDTGMPVEGRYYIVQNKRHQTTCLLRRDLLIVPERSWAVLRPRIFCTISARSPPKQKT
jgi:hypothetical protein